MVDEGAHHMLENTSHISESLKSAIFPQRRSIREPYLYEERRMV